MIGSASHVFSGCARNSFIAAQAVELQSGFVTETNTMDFGDGNFSWAFLATLAVAGAVALIRHWLLGRWMGKPEPPPATPRRGFEIIQTQDDLEP